jgi:hypothetical protein
MSDHPASGHRAPHCAAGAPIFIHGIFERSGTNYLAALLNLHPDCHASWLHENWMLSECDDLERYAEKMSARWRREPAWQTPSDIAERLLWHLGAGLLSFLAGGADDKRLLTKTPGVERLERFFTMFPSAYLLILVRDGRSVVESSAKSWGSDPGQVARSWAAAADRILRFDREHRGVDQRYRIVRYEDLLRDTRSQVTELLLFLHLDVDRYDFAAIQRLPVFGSSTTRDRAGNWAWQISPRLPGLGSLERWSGWHRGQHERFNWTAGAQLEAFGYEPVRARERRALWLALTAGWAVASLPRRALEAWRTRRKGRC